MSERISIPELQADFGEVRDTRGDDFERLIRVGDLLALVDAIIHAYRGTDEDAKRLNDNHLCMVCRVWSHGDEQIHGGGCPGTLFDFNMDT